MADGSLVFDTRIDTREFIKGSITLRSQAGKIVDAVKKAGKEVQKALEPDTNGIQSGAKRMQDSLQQVQEQARQTGQATEQEFHRVETKAKTSAQAAETAGEKLQEALNVDSASASGAAQEVKEQLESVGTKADETKARIEQILNDGERSAKSKAAAIAAIYKKQGLNQSDAFKKAWEHIERSSKQSNESIRKDTEKTAKQMKKQMNSAADSVGKCFSGMSGQISHVFKRLGGMLAGTLAAGKLVSLGKEAITYASDLQEVQNVVDTAFGNMADKMEQFSDTSIEMYGISKLTAKEMGSTYMAMAKGIGLASEEASDMALNTTARTADIMSFYNKSASEAQTMMKSIYTGETESLKAIGVVMTEANLQNFAYTKGIQKKISAMTEQEKVMLRYEYVMNQTALAEGDFSKTSGSWANQTRILSEQFKELLGIVGSGLMQVLLPGIKLLNAALARLIQFAAAAGETLSKLFGVDAGTSSAAAVAEDADAAAGALEDMTDAQKEAARATTGIDELNIISDDSDNASSGSGNTSTGSGMSGIANEIREEEAAIDKVNSKIQALIDKGKELAGVFSTGFWDGFGDVSVLSSVQQSIDRIKGSVSDIFSSEETAVSVDTFVQKTLSSLGTISGSALSIGVSLADNLLGGIGLYTEQNSGGIKDHIAGLFDLSGRASEISAKFSSTASEIFSSLRSEPAKQVTADIIALFSEGFFGVTELTGKFTLDVADTLISPFEDNKEEIRKTLEDTYAAVEPIIKSLDELVEDSFTNIQETYDESVAPTFKSLKEGFSEIVEETTEGYNEHILPVINDFGEKFKEFKDEHLQPLIDKFLDFAAKVSEAVDAIWGVLEPLIIWFIEKVFPVIAQGLSDSGDDFFEFWGMVSDVVGFIFDALGGLVQFISGVLTGDWEGAWEGIKEIFEGVWNGIKAIFDFIMDKIVDHMKSKLEEMGFDWDETWETIKSVINSILGGIEGMANGAVRGINRIIDAINGLSFDIPDWVPGFGGKTFGFNIKTLGEVSIPRLAQGGFVPANTPRLAMIGDNRTQGEIVSPEDRLQEMAMQAAAMASQNNLTGQYLQIMIELLRQIIELIENFDLVVNIDIRELRKKLKDLELRTGYGFT